jgi:excisionase family DNA binding protein
MPEINTCYTMECKEMLDSDIEKSKLAYSVEEVSEQTSLSKAFLRLEIRRGNLKATPFGRRKLICKADLDQYLINGSEGSKTTNSDEILAPN